MVFRIHVEHSECGSPYRGLADQIDSLPLKMLAPLLTTRMKQLGYLVGLRIEPGQVRSFVQIAIDAGESKVINIIGSTMSPRDNVLHVKRRQRRICLM